jgi:hypothetical protein
MRGIVEQVSKFQGFEGFRVQGKGKSRGKNRARTMSKDPLLPKEGRNGAPGPNVKSAAFINLLAMFYAEFRAAGVQ